MCYRQGIRTLALRHDDGNGIMNLGNRTISSLDQSAIGPDGLVPFDRAGRTYAGPINGGGGNDVNALDYVAIGGGLSLANEVAHSDTDVDISDYLQDAHIAAGVGGRIYYPPGDYTAANIEYYEGQAIDGSGFVSTTCNQIGNNHFFVPYNWISNVAHLYGLKNTFTRLGFASSLSSTSGHAIISWSSRNKFFQNQMSGFGVFCPVHTQNGTIIDNPSGAVANQAGHRFIDNNFINCPLGAISCNSGDKVTDTYLIGNLLTGNGAQSADGSIQIACLAVPGYGGWIITANKFQNSPGAFIDSEAPEFFDDTNDQSTQIFGNLFDWKATSPKTAGVNYCIRITPNASGRISILGNEFKGPRNGGGSQNYTFISIADSGSISGQSSIGSNIFDFKSGYSGTILAIQIDNPTNTPGTCFDNVYDVLFSIAQRGNGDVVWGPQMPTLPSAPSGTGIPGQYGMYLNNLYAVNGSGAWKTFTSSVAGGAVSFPSMAEPATGVIPANTWIAYTDSSSHKAVLKFSDGTKVILTP